MPPKLSMIMLAHVPRASIATLTDELNTSLKSLINQGIDCWEVHVVVCAQHEQVFRESSRINTRIKWHVLTQSSQYRLDIDKLLKKIHTDWVGFMYAGDALRADSLYWLLKPILKSAQALQLVTYAEQTEQYAQGKQNHSYIEDLAQNRPSPDLQWESGYLDAHFIVRKDFALKQLSHYPMKSETPLNIVRAVANRIIAPLANRQRVPVTHVRQRLLERGSTCQIRKRLQDSVQSKIELIKDLRRMLETFSPGTGVLLLNKEKAWLQLDWPIARQEPFVHIVIPTRDRLDLLKPCLRSLLSQTEYSNYRVTVIDNGSIEPETLCYLSILPKRASKKNIKISVLRDDRPFNFSALNNKVLSDTSDGVLVFLNNDIVVLEPHWLKEMVCHAMRPDVGCVGAKLLYSDGTIQHLGVSLGATHIASHLYSTEHPKRWPSHNPILSCVSNPVAVTAAAMAIRAEVFHKLGGFNEDQLAVAYNDVDLCLRAEEAGLRTVCTPRATMIHQESMSRKQTAEHVSDTNELHKKNQSNQANSKLSDLKRERQESSWMRKRWSSQLALYTGNQTP